MHGSVVVSIVCGSSACPTVAAGSTAADGLSLRSGVPGIGVGAGVSGTAGVVDGGSSSVRLFNGIGAATSAVGEVSNTDARYGVAGVTTSVDCASVVESVSPAGGVALSGPGSNSLRGNGPTLAVSGDVGWC